MKRTIVELKVWNSYLPGMVAASIYYRRQWFICYLANAHCDNMVDFFSNILSGYFINICCDDSRLSGNLKRCVFIKINFNSFNIYKNYSL